MRSFFMQYLRGCLMDIINLNINDITPYGKNPRRNDKAVDYVANSIKRFGFWVPLVIDKDNIVVCGHTRLKAAEKLKLKTLPCVRAEGLTTEQINAFRIADNKVSEMSKWNIKLLQEEIKPLKEKIDFTEFGFDSPKEDKPNERIKTVEGYNLDYYVSEFADNKWGMPELDAVDYTPKNLIGFNYAKTSKEYENGIHFYIDDYQFERIWNNPEKYIELLSRFDCALTPDFSLYLDMPLAMQMWNIYRSRMIGQIMQQHNLKVIPTVSWSDAKSFEFCFDGLPKNATLSVSTIGVKRNDEAYNIWKNGMDEMISRLYPKRLLVYGGCIPYEYMDIEVIYYENNVTERMKNSK